MSKLKVVAAFAALLMVAVIGTVVITSAKSIETGAGDIKTPKLLAKTNEQRIEFLKQFGWEVDAEPVEVVEVVIPTEFDDVYEKYNIIQKKQGFDLTGFKGKRMKRWTYTVKNYPDKKDNVRANILVLDGKVAGGDVCSVELNGFMHGFDLN
jgi:hypothetical protein